MADRQSHAVSDADLGATRQLLAATPGLVGELRAAMIDLVRRTR